MRKCVILVDNSNLFIGGQQCAAERQRKRGSGNGHAPGDPAWRLDFDELLTCLADGRPVHRAIMVGSHPDGDEGPRKAARESGFEVVVHVRDAGHGEKRIDTELAVRGTEIVATESEPMVLVIASGDRDFVPLVEAAHRHDWEVEMCAFSNSYHAGGELAQAADRVRPLDGLLTKIGFYDRDGAPRS